MSPLHTLIIVWLPWHDLSAQDVIYQSCNGDFQHNNAAYHRVLNWSQENDSVCGVIHWSSQSPDQNLVEC